MMSSSCIGSAESCWRGHLVCARLGLKNPVQYRAVRRAKPSVEGLFDPIGPCASICAPVPSTAAKTLDFALSKISFTRSVVVMPLREVSYSLYVDQATSSVNAVSGRVTCNHLCSARGE
jgi:hypothetical protein